MSSGAYLVILFFGAIVVIVDGQLILHTAPTYLSEVYNREPAQKVSQLVTVLFHLIMLGLVAVTASIGLGPDPTVPDIVRRLGWILLLVAVGHVAAMVGLSRLRQEQEETDLAEAQIHGPGGAHPQGRDDPFAPPVRHTSPRDPRGELDRRPPGDPGPASPALAEAATGDTGADRAAGPADRPDPSGDRPAGSSGDRPAEAGAPRTDPPAPRFDTDVPPPPDPQPITTRSTDPDAPLPRHPH